MTTHIRAVVEITDWLGWDEEDPNEIKRIIREILEDRADVEVLSVIITEHKIKKGGDNPQTKKP
jgi:hypothetical protein